MYSFFMHEKMGRMCQQQGKFYRGRQSLSRGSHLVGAIALRIERRI